MTKWGKTKKNQPYVKHEKIEESDIGFPQEIITGITTSSGSRIEVKPEFVDHTKIRDFVSPATRRKIEQSGTKPIEKEINHLNNEIEIDKEIKQIDSAIKKTGSKVKPFKNFVKYSNGFKSSLPPTMSTYDKRGLDFKWKGFKIAKWNKNIPMMKKIASEIDAIRKKHNLAEIDWKFEV